MNGGPEDRIVGSVNIEHIPHKGRGLIATRPISQGATILRDPAVKLDDGDREFLDKTVLRTYYHFYKDAQTMDHYICFGSGSLLNHSEAPNVTKRFEQDDLGPWLIVTAMRDIDEGEELCLRYLDPGHFRLQE